MTPQFQGGRSGSSRGRSHKPASAASPKSSEAIRPLDPTLTPPDITTFRHWELGEEIQGAIEAMGITVPSPIQRLAIGPVLAGKDVIAKAETGTGKTLAFGAPMMAKIDPQRASVLGLVMCPTRELAEQVQKVLSDLGKPRGIEVALIVGGEPMEPQIKALKRGAQVVVGTPGRILDLYKQRFLSFPWTEFAILDEADVMFEFGFIDDVKEILSYTPEERQTLLFSATFPVELLKLARENTRDPAEVATAAGLKTVDNIEQSVIFLDDEDRTLALMRLIENSDPEDTFLVFCPRRTDVDKLIRRLERMPFSIKALHGGYDQAARFRVMAAFRTGEVKALIATDVASRGLDVKHVSTVVNYGSPHDITDYTHRIGRTGRAGRKGRAITLVGGIDRRKWTQIEREATWKIPEVDPPLRGERPRPRRDEVPVGQEMPVADARPPRADRARSDRPARDERAPREDRPRREERPAPAAAAPTDRARREERPAREGRHVREERPLRAREAGAPAARSTADRGEPRFENGRAERPWPRDEHSPVRAEAPGARGPVRQIEPRPDDPVDRRDRPLRQRAEPPHWPADDDAPRREERSERDAAPRADSPRREAPRHSSTGSRASDNPALRNGSPRGEPLRNDAPRHRAPRDEVQRDQAPRAAESGSRAESRPHGRDARSERPARPEAGAARASSRPAEAPRVPFFAPEEPAPEHDMRPRGPDAAPRRPAARADAGRGAPARREAEAPRAREARGDEAPRRATRAHGADATRAEPAPRRASAPQGDRAPRAAPRDERAPRAASAARADSPAARAPVEPPRPIAPRPVPRRRVDPSQVDPGEVRPIQSRRREPRPDR